VWEKDRSFKPKHTHTHFKSLDLKIMVVAVMSKSASIGGATIFKMDERPIKLNLIIIYVCDMP
jgi:macrodomain Ter protein organizer (MatP/YcbG family)